MQYFEVTGKYATENGIAVDVFCTGEPSRFIQGAESLGIPAFQALVKPSEGYALSHDSFQAPPLAHNLSYVVSLTQMSIADCSQALDMVEGAPPSIENHLEGCIADIRTSRYVVLRE